MKPKSSNLKDFLLQESPSTDKASGSFIDSKYIREISSVEKDSKIKCKNVFLQGTFAK